MAREQNNLFFLRCANYEIIKRNNGTYSIQIRTNGYLHVQCYHHPAQLQLVAKTLITRPQKLADQEHRNEKVNIVETA